MKIIKTAQMAAAPAPSPTAGGPTPPVPVAPTPAAAGLGLAGPNQPQDNSAASQMKRMMSMLGTLPVAMIDTPEEKEVALMMSQQLKLVAAQLEQVAKKPDVAAPTSEASPVGAL